MKNPKLQQAYMNQFLSQTYISDQVKQNSSVKVQNIKQNNKIFANKEKKSAFSYEQKLKFKQLYEKYRSKWTRIALELPGRNDLQIKNFFYNSARELGARMVKIQKEKKIFQKRGLQCQTFHKFIDLSLIIKQYTTKMGLAENQQLLIHKVRREFLQMIVEQNFSDQRVWELTKNFRNLKFQYRNLKVKSNFKYSQAELQKIVDYTLNPRHILSKSTQIQASNPQKQTFLNTYISIQNQINKDSQQIGLYDINSQIIEWKQEPNNLLNQFNIFLDINQQKLQLMFF